MNRRSEICLYLVTPPLPVNDDQVIPISKGSDVSRMVTPQPRMGARGVKKVKTGCKTCKIRHKKCDEVWPACSQCSSTGRVCDLSQSNPSHNNTESSDMALLQRPRMNLELLQKQPSLPYHLRNLTHAEASHLDYFRLVCARDFALCFESMPWESFLLQNVHREPSICHAALAIAALSRHHYAPIQVWYDPGNTSTTGSAIEFSMLHYNLAIQILNRHLERGSIESSKLAVLASILFIHIEAFHDFQNNDNGFPNLISAHLNGGLTIVRSLKSLSQNVDDLENVIDHIQNQIQQFQHFAAR